MEPGSNCRVFSCRSGIPARSTWMTPGSVLLFLVLFVQGRDGLVEPRQPGRYFVNGLPTPTVSAGVSIKLNNGPCCFQFLFGNAARAHQS